MNLPVSFATIALSENNHHQTAFATEAVLTTYFVNTVEQLESGKASFASGALPQRILSANQALGE